MARHSRWLDAESSALVSRSRACRPPPGELAGGRRSKPSPPSRRRLYALSGPSLLSALSASGRGCIFTATGQHHGPHGRGTACRHPRRRAEAPGATPRDRISPENRPALKLVLIHGIRARDNRSFPPTPTPPGARYNPPRPPGRGSVWQSTWFGIRGSQVQILPPRRGPSRGTGPGPQAATDPAPPGFPSSHPSRDGIFPFGLLFAGSTMYAPPLMPETVVPAVPPFSLRCFLTFPKRM